jgi:hypothetical protein
LNKIFNYSLLSFILLTICHLATAQKNNPGYQRCYTMEAIEQRLEKDPAFKARFEQGKRDYQFSTQKNETFNTLSYEALGITVIIPVVVHIVLNDPTIVTDDDVNYFIQRLNEDFSGLNADSTNAPEFYDKRGHSLIRFTLARRDPQGIFTTGIERKNGDINIGISEPQAIKNSAAGGLSSWPPSDYYNIWIGKGPEGVIGIAPEIGPGSAESDGVCIDYRVFTNNSCYANPLYNLSRTAVHEIGHNLGLYHIFHGGCNLSSDFGQLTTPGISLPVELLDPADDTPNQLESTNGCPSGNISSGCTVSPNPPGKMYQNFMDYTDDACYSMFTKGQVERMHWVILKARVGYLTSMGNIPPVTAPVNDAELTAVINPGGSENISGNCLSYTIPSCPGTINPRVRVTNRGINNLLSITVGLQLNNEDPVMKSFNINLGYGESAVLPLDAIDLDYGNNALKFFTNAPNNGIDQQMANDTLVKMIEILSPVTGVLIEGFESPTFPPAGWTIRNTDGDATWKRNFYGNNSNASAFFDNFNYDKAGETDDLVSLPLNTISLDSLVLTFDLAHKDYPGAKDKLTILVTGDCGQSYTIVYTKSGSDLSTAGSSTSEYTSPSPADWRRERIAIGGSVLNAGQLQIVFRNENDFGNNIFIDNIQIEPIKLVDRDLQLLLINQPGNVICDGKITPSILVKNAGSKTITGFKMGYRLGIENVISNEFTGINLSSGQTMLVNFSTGNMIAGQNQLTVFSYDLVTTGGNGDEQLQNDTLSMQIGVAGSIEAPFVEGFESFLFPPAGWAIGNYDDQITWQSALAGSTGSYSAMIRNFNYPLTGAIDELYTPVINYNNIDSLFLKFDVAASPSGLDHKDTLEVLITRDCGVSYTSVYKKWGTSLQTVTEFQTSEFQPTPQQWRTDSINLTQFASQSPMQIVFRNINRNRNNIYLDNIKIQTITLPARLKQEGLLLMPNPFQNSFTIWHYKQPSNLQFISVYNTTGQHVWKKEFNNNAGTNILIDLTGKPAGMYIIQLGYKDPGKNTSHKVIKN